MKKDLTQGNDDSASNGKAGYKMQAIIAALFIVIPAMAIPLTRAIILTAFGF